MFRGESDPYFPSRCTHDMHATEDWIFRVRVISTATDLDNDVFKKAVQGLVKICFQQGILEELGIDIVTQHMKEENASKDNIEKMSDIFRAEMIYRITFMLAEYLDTAGKIERGIQSVIAASASLHHVDASEGLLGRITKTLSTRKTKTSGSDSSSDSS